MKNKRGTPSPLPFYLQAALMDAAPEILPALMGTAAREPARNAAKTLSQMIAGIERWQSIAPAPAHGPPGTLWRLGPASLLDIGGTGPAVLVIPSLINKSSILDLTENVSFVNELRANGLRPVLLDWGAPDETTGRFDLADHVSQVLIPAVHFLAGLSGAPVGVIGYCMGGSLAIALATQAAPAVSGLVVIGAPWNFSDLPDQSAKLRDVVFADGGGWLSATLDGIAHIYGAVPDTVFQHLFAWLSPLQARDKFARFAEMPGDGPEFDLFCAIETWVNDGCAVAGPAARTLLVDWYCRNATHLERWDVNGRPVRLRDIRCPALSVIGTKDHIVPANLSPALPESTANGHLLEVDAGHVGMVVGRHHAETAYRVCAFLSQKTVP